MGRYRKIETHIWNDAKFRTLSDDGKFVFLFLLTHPALLPLGVMRCFIAGLAAELKWQPDRLRDALATLSSNGMARADEEAGVIVIPNYLKYNSPENPNVVKSWEKLFEEVPECELTESYLLHVVDFVKQLGDNYAERLPQRYLDEAKNRLRNQEPEQEPNQEQQQEHSLFSSSASPANVSENSASTGVQKNSLSPRERAGVRATNLEARQSSKNPARPQPPEIIGSVPSPEEIYAAYPRKAAKANALKAIAQAVKKIPAAELLDVVKEYAAAVADQDPKYIPHCATWMHGERWLDDRAEWNRKSRPPTAENPARLNGDATDFAHYAA